MYTIQQRGKTKITTYTQLAITRANRIISEAKARDMGPRNPNYPIPIINIIMQRHTGAGGYFLERWHHTRRFGQPTSI